VPPAVGPVAVVGFTAGALIGALTMIVPTNPLTAIARSILTTEAAKAVGQVVHEVAVVLRARGVCQKAGAVALAVAPLTLIMVAIGVRD
jgi:hypothetical protein